MKRRLVLVTAWLAATAASVLLASFAVGAVGSQVTQEPESVLVAARSPDASLAPTTSPSATAVAPEPAAPATSVLGTVDPSEFGPDPIPVPPPPTSPPSTSPPSPPAPTSPPASPSTSVSAPVPTSPPTSSAPAPASGIKTLAGRGGSLTVEIRGGRLVFLGAVPSAGFSIADQDVSDTEIRVEFESDDHETKIKAELHDGVFDGEVEEEAKD